MPDLTKLPKSYRDRLPQNMLEALNQLSAHEAKIMQALSDPKTAAFFAENPAEALKQMKVPVNPLLMRKLEEAARSGRLNRFSAYQMPNGQTVTPNVRIRFVKGGR